MTLTELTEYFIYDDVNLLLIKNWGLGLFLAILNSSNCKILLSTLNSLRLKFFSAEAQISIPGLEIIGTYALDNVWLTIAGS